MFPYLKVTRLPLSSSLFFTDSLISSFCKLADWLVGLPLFNSQSLCDKWEVLWYRLLVNLVSKPFEDASLWDNYICLWQVDVMSLKHSRGVINKCYSVGTYCTAQRLPIAVWERADIEVTIRGDGHSKQRDLLCIVCQSYTCSACSMWWHFSHLFCHYSCVWVYVCARVCVNFKIQLDSLVQVEEWLFVCLLIV